MIYQVFAVKDSKAAAFALPFFLPRMEVALRSFRDAIKDPKHDMSRHPEDYSLWCLGEFDDNTGEMKPVEPVLVARATDPAEPSERPPTTGFNRIRDGFDPRVAAVANGTSFQGDDGRTYHPDGSVT